MKKIFYLLILSFFLFSCGKITEEKIIGKWSFEILSYSYVEFKENGEMIVHQMDNEDVYTWELVQEGKNYYLLIDGNKAPIQMFGNYLHIYIFEQVPLYLQKMEDEKIGMFNTLH